MQIDDWAVTPPICMNEAEDPERVAFENGFHLQIPTPKLG